MGAAHRSQNATIVGTYRRAREGRISGRMGASKLPRGPRKDEYVKSYGKFRVEVYSLPAHRVVVYEMDGYITAEHLDAYIDDLLAVTSEQRPRGMIADPKSMSVLSVDFQRAIQNRFWPGIARLGVKRNPAIIPQATVTQTSVKRMVDGAGEKISVGAGLELEIAVFETLEQCLEWIGRLRGRAVAR